MRIQDVIVKERSGLENTPAELQTLIQGFLEGNVCDYHVASWLMAVFLKGMGTSEVQTLTNLMWKSGETLPKIGNYSVDKHSTGGVGDKTSLILVPLVASVCKRLFGEDQVTIPMISGRGLGMTGGTLDKLESIPGFNPSISVSEATRLLKTNGFCMMGQTDNVAPADKKIYALRDSTATIESIPLIVASILSKKFSENLDGIVFDVKVGRGAFMDTPERGKELAGTLVKVSQSLGKDAVALITRMDEPLGYKIGHFLEVEECWEFLEGERETGLSEVVLALASWMVHFAARKKINVDEARAECEAELQGESPKLAFETLFKSQGGQWSEFATLQKTLRSETQCTKVKSPTSGTISAIDPRSCAKLIADLGGAREKISDKIDPFVGIELLKKVGEPVNEHETVACVFHRSKDEGLINEKGLSLFEVSANGAEKEKWVMEAIR